MKRHFSLRKKLEKMRGYIAAVLGFIMLFLSGCTDPPIRSERVSDANKYLKVNSYVKQQLSEVFFALFPEEIPENASLVSYCYEYECGIFGDPNFIISLKTAFEDEDGYKAEKASVVQMNPTFTKAEEDAEYIFFLGSEGDMEAYLDDEILDGRHFLFCLSILDDKTQTLEYIYADLYDGSELREEMTEILMPLV